MFGTGPFESSFPGSVRSQRPLTRSRSAGPPSPLGPLGRGEWVSAFLPASPCIPIRDAISRPASPNPPMGSDIRFLVPKRSPGGRLAILHMRQWRELSVLSRYQNRVQSRPPVCPPTAWRVRAFQASRSARAARLRQGPAGRCPFRRPAHAPEAAVGRSGSRSRFAGRVRGGRNCAPLRLQSDRPRPARAERYPLLCLPHGRESPENSGRLDLQRALHPTC